MERRRYERFARQAPVILHVERSENERVSYRVELQNVSAGGMCFLLLCPAQAVLGPIVQGRVEIDRPGEPAPLEMKFSIQWKRGQSDGSLLFGICFDSACDGIVDAVTPDCHIHVWL